MSRNPTATKTEAAFDPDKAPFWLNVLFIAMSVGITALAIAVIAALVFAIGFVWTCGSLAAVALLHGPIPIDFN